MFLVVFISFVLFVTSTSSNSEGLNASNDSRVILEGREIFETLSSLDFNLLVPVQLSITNNNSHQYIEEDNNKMTQTTRSNALQLFANGLEEILGFGSLILDFANLFGIYLGEASKYSIDDVMNQLNAQFADIKNQLAVIYNRMLKQDIDAYRAVEDAVTAANTDIQLSSTLDLISRGLRLSDKLFIFSKGMLGQNGMSADILQVTSDLLKVLPLLLDKLLTILLIKC